MESSDYFDNICIAQIVVGMPAVAVSAVSLFNQSTQDHLDALRQKEILGLPVFFDHTGNCINGALAASLVLYGGLLVNKYVSPEHRKAVTIGASAYAALGSVGVNIAYEASVSPPHKQHPSEAGFDIQDAAYGGITGILLSAAFCASALIKKIRSGKSSATAS